MWMYERRLEYPIKIKNPNPALAKFIISQYGGPHGEIGASLRYLSQQHALSPSSRHTKRYRYRRVGSFGDGLYYYSSTHKRYDCRTNKSSRYAGLFRRSYRRSLSTSCFRRASQRRYSGSYRRCYSRHSRRYGGRTESTPHLRQHSPYG